MHATVEDYTDRLNTTPTPEEARQITARLQDASDLIDARTPPGWDPPAGLARSIAVTAAHRAITNPGGRRSVTVGQTSESYGEHGGVYLTAKEVEELEAAYQRQAAAVEAFTVMPEDAGLTSRGWWR